MKSKIILWIVVTVVLIAWDYYRHKNKIKTITAAGTFVWISSLATVGITLRTILPLFVVHYALILFSWVALMYYLWKGRYYWWVFALPALTLLTYLGLNFVQGSRYEA